MKENPIIGKSITDVIIEDISNKQRHSLMKLAHDKSLLLVFLDKGCVHCSNNFEIFLNTAKNHPRKKFAVIMVDSQEKAAKELFDLHNQEFKVYFAPQSFFAELQLKYLPAFVYTSYGVIKNVTPVPEFAFYEKPIITYGT